MKCNFSWLLAGSCALRSSVASSVASPRCPPRLVVPLSPAAPLAAPTEGSFVRPEPTPRVRYANRVPLQYEEADEEDEEMDEWMRLYGLDGSRGTISAATGRRLSPIRAFGQHHHHRRTASLDNIVDGIAPGTSLQSAEARQQQRDRLRAELPDLADESVRHAAFSRWSPQRVVGKPQADSTPASKENKAISARSPEEPSSGLKTRLKSISDKYLKNPVAGIMTNGRDTITSGLLSKIKSGHKSKNAGRHRCEQDGANRSSFRSFSCSTLPALDEFQRKKMLAAVAASEMQDELDSTAASPSVPRGEGDSDSGIVPEWSDTSSISESSYIRHYQPCQLLSSWRKPQPKVRRSLSPIFQYRAMEGQVDEVDSSINTSVASTAAYETLWPTEEGDQQVKEHLSILSGEESALHVEDEDEELSLPLAASASPAPEDERREPAGDSRAHTTRIHIEYSPPDEAQVATAVMDSPPSQRRASSRPHYQTASLDRRALKETKLAVSDREGGASVHLIKIERDPDNLKAELGIFIAKKKLARGSVGYLVAHIVPGGLVDRYSNLVLEKVERN